MPIFISLLFLLIFSTSTLAYHPRVIFDQGHGQVFVIEKESDLHLSKLAHTFLDQGYEVSSTSHPLTAQLLDNTDALVISGAFTPFAASEIAEIARFIERGGRLTLMIHIGQPIQPLLYRLGVEIANGVIHEEQHIIDKEPLNFRTNSLRPHPLTLGLKSFALYGTWPLRPITPSGQTLAYTSSRSWVDLSGDKRRSRGDAVQAFGVLVGNRIGHGELMVFGDDALFQNRFLTGSNQDLAVNLARWLAAGKAPSGQAI
jgi:hypothetical protein